jgi:hypothetical protein
MAKQKQKLLLLDVNLEQSIIFTFRIKHINQHKYTKISNAVY